MFLRLYKRHLNVLVLFSTLWVSAQENILKGQLKANGLDKSFIEIVNLSQYKVSISQLDGKFKIEAKTGDTILITSIQYNEYRFIVKQEYFEQTININLKEKVNQLQTVNLFSLALSGDLEKDAVGVKTDLLTLKQLGYDAKVEYFSEPENRFIEEKRMTRDFLYRLIDPNYKSRYSDLRDDEIDMLNNLQFKLVVPADYIIEELNIKSNKVDDFIIFCFEQYPSMKYFLERKDKLLLFEMLPNMAKAYLKIKITDKI